MEGNYAVSFGGRPCGKVQVLRQGLYYRFICHCKTSSNMIFRLRLSCNGKLKELGILVPVDNGFGLEKKIPVKYFEKGVPEFSLYTGEKNEKGTFIPIVPEEPFSYIGKLREAYLVRRNGQAGIII